MGNDSHDQHYLQLQAVRESWCRTTRVIHDRSDVAIELDGRELVDIPSFFLRLAALSMARTGTLAATLTHCRTVSAVGSDWSPRSRFGFGMLMPRGTRWDAMPCCDGVNLGLPVLNLIRR